MVDYTKLMSILSIPRPNGSHAVEKTRLALEDWLTHQRISFRRETFTLSPYFFELIGIWLILSRVLLAAAVVLRWGWPALVIALVSLPGGLLDVALNIPTVTRLGRRPGHNLLVEFGPPPGEARQELVLSAHYDSKSEPLDHRQRMFFLKNLPTGILLTIFLGLLGPIDRFLLDQGSPGAGFTFVLGLVLSAMMVFLASGLGLNLSLGRLWPQSCGSVDNGTACAILLGLARRLQDSAIPLENTRVTLALFAGEEVNMQGSRAYVRSREWPRPAACLNLEVMAQDGEYVFWERDGNSMKLVPASAALNRLVADSVAAVTGKPARAAGPINSDGGSFLLAGLPATTLGTYDTRLVDRGFHSPADNLGRVVMDRLPESVAILAHFITEFDRHEFARQA